MLAAAIVATTAAQAQTARNATSGIVISKVFYAGTTQAESNKNYTAGEEYIELHNNTANALNVAGCYIGLVESENGTGAYPAGSIGANTVVLKQLYQIPGDTVVMQPWGTLTIATAAIDHSSAAKNGPDLSKADFEFGGESNDNPAVPNLTQVFTYVSTMTKVNLTNGGDCSLLLFPASFSSHIDLTDSLTYANGKTKGSQYLKVNSYYAMDGVEILKTKADGDDYVVDATRKRLTTSKDSGYVDPHLNMLRNGYVAYRKTALAYDGNIYLYDTDNSTRDFEISATVKPGEYDTTASGVTDLTVTIPESGYLAVDVAKPFFTDNGIYVTTVNVSRRNLNAGEAGGVTFNSNRGDSLLFSEGTYILVGTPGDKTLHLSDARRMISSAGSLNWLEDNDEKLSGGVFTESRSGRYPMRFVNETGNVRFIADNDNGNTKTMKFDATTDSRAYIEALAEVSEIKLGGITPAGVVTGISSITAQPAADAVYNLQGVRVDASSLPKGIYIKAGRKFVVK